MEAVRTSETQVYFYKTTWHYIPEGCHLKNLLTVNIFYTNTVNKQCLITMLINFSMDEPFINITFYFSVDAVAKNSDSVMILRSG
jgi:hypothetical protein